MKIEYIFLVLTLIAEIIGTIGGFGSSVFFVPVGNLYFSFHTVLGLTAVFHVFSNLSKILLFRKGIDRRLILYLGLPSILFVIIGGIATNYFPGKTLSVILSLFLIIFSLYFLLNRANVIKASNRNATFGGILSGFSAGLLGTGGAIRGLTMAAFNLEKQVFIATSAFIDFLIDFSRTFVYYANGFIDEQVIYYIPFLLIIGFIGSYIGKLILKQIPQKKFRNLSLVLILIIGISILFKYVLDMSRDWMIM